MNAPLFSESDEQSFKQSFAAQFLASYAASIYGECCSSGQHDRLRNLPVEDAEHLARHAWQKWVEVIGVDFPNG
jgi:hypothetical protein